MKAIKPILLAIGRIVCQLSAFCDDSTSGKITKPISKLDDSGQNKPTPPAKPDNPTASTEIKDIIQNFEQSRESLLANQKALQESLKGASQDERDKIREQLKAAKDALAAQREQFRDQLKEARDKLVEQGKKLKDDAVDAAKKTGKPRGD